MPKIKQIIIPIILLPFLFGLTGCEKHKPKTTNAKISIHDIPTEKTDLLDEKIGIPHGFAHIIVHTQNNNKRFVFKRKDKHVDENGRVDDLYETRKIELGPIKMSILEKQEAYHVTPFNNVTLNGQEYSNCNYITVGKKEKLICKKTTHAPTPSSPEQYTTLNKNISDKNIPDSVVQYIENKTKEELSYLVLVGKKKSTILKNSSYEFINLPVKFGPQESPEYKKLDPKYKATAVLPPLSVITTFFIRNPCCCVTNDNDTAVETCKRKC